MMNAYQAQRYARLAGALLLVSLVAGAFGESYVPEKLQASSDVAETARRVGSDLGLFRAGFAAYLLEAACDLTLTAVFYVLLRPVSRTLALISLCFGLFGTFTFAVGEIFYYAAGLPAMDAHVAAALSPEGRASFTYLCLNMYGQVFAIFTGFYGLDSALRGYLIFRSQYFPRWIGGALMVGGAGFVLKNVFVLLAPRYDSLLLVAPMMFAMLCLAVWFLGKGIRREAWERSSLS